jgi:transposase-like protein
VWLYYRFDLSHRDIEELLAERAIHCLPLTIRLTHAQVAHGSRYLVGTLVAVG